MPSLLVKSSSFKLSMSIRGTLIEQVCKFKGYKREAGKYIASPQVKPSSSPRATPREKLYMEIVDTWTLYVRMSSVSQAAELFMLSFHERSRPCPGAQHLAGCPMQTSAQVQLCYNLQLTSDCGGAMPIGRALDLYILS